MAANTAAAGHCVYAYTNPECTGWEVLKWCPTFSRGGLTTTTTCVANVDFERSTDWGVEDDGYIMGVEVY